MARARKITETIPAVEKVTGVTLTLSIEEALAISALTGQVCGTGGPQELTSKIYHALNMEGLGYPYGKQGGIVVTPNSSTSPSRGYSLSWKRNT